MRVLIDLAAEHGVAGAVCLEGAGLKSANLTDADARVAAGQELAVIRNLLRALPDVPGLGLRAGGRYHLTTHGIWGLAIASSPDLRGAIRFGLRYLDLTFAFTQIALNELPREAQMTLDASALPEDVRRFLIEREGASIMSLQREMFTAAIPLSRVEVTFPAPPYAELYESVFGVRPRFGASANLAAFDVALLDLPLPQANELTAKACERQCSALLEQRRPRLGIAGQVRDHLVPLAGVRLAIEDVATDLRVSPRTLRRRLASEGTSFRALAEEVTMGLAEEFLSSGTLTVEEVAVRLGYSEAASFTRAFSRSRGVPPGEYRRRAIAAADSHAASAQAAGAQAASAHAASSQAAGAQFARSSASPSSFDFTG